MIGPEFVRSSAEIAGGRKSPRRTWVTELVETVLPALAIAVAVNLFLVQPRTVHGQSMEPNLHESQRLLVDLVTYHLRAPRRGEIVILDVPRVDPDPLVKRVVGLPGETIEIREGIVYVNNRRLAEPYLHQITPGTLVPQVVPEGHVFVLGDNRASSYDSRYFGMVPFEAILGRACARFWPPQDISLVK